MKVVPQVCEICFSDRATTLSADRNEKWFFMCDSCACEKAYYDIEFERILERHGKWGWPEHLEESKDWFQEDKANFYKHYEFLVNMLGGK